MKSKSAAENTAVIPHLSVTKFLQNLEGRAWTDAEKELDTIRQKAENSPWSKGYVKALEGLLLTNRSNDDEYAYLPKVLADGTKENIESLKDEFSQFASNDLHGDYDRGYFKALSDYLEMVSKFKDGAERQPPAAPEQEETPPVKGDSREEYSEEST